MNKKSDLIEKRVNFKWIKAESGSTYLCPVNILNRLGTLTDEQLRTLCVDESANPHND